jgi:prepilin-type processing-associated H-X9-DG protein
MKQLGLAILNYESTHRTFPLAYTPNWTGGSAYDIPPNRLKKHNLLTFLLPFIEQQAIYDQIDFGLDYVAHANRPATLRDMPEFLCPTAPSRVGDFGGDYAACVAVIEGAYVDLLGDGLVSDRGCPPIGSGDRPCEALDGMLRDDRTTVNMVPDGLSKTIALYEDAGRPFHFIRGQQQESPVQGGTRWADPAQYFVWGNSPDCGLTTVMNCSNWDEIYSFHSGGANFTYGDGSVHFHTESMAPETIISLISRIGGETITEEL